MALDFRYVSLLLLLVILLSGCVSFPGIFSGFKITGAKYTKTEDLRIESEAIPKTLFSGKRLNVLFKLSNKGNTTLKNVRLKITDPCLFTPRHREKFFSELKSGEIEEWEWEFSSKPTRVERNCKIRYQVVYSSESNALYDITTLSEEERKRLLKKGELKEKIPLNFFKTKSPVDIQVELSKTQPILEDSSFYFHLKLVNKGEGGTVDQGISNLEIEYPEFLFFRGSNDFSSFGNKARLRKSLTFFGGETKKTTIKFETRDVQVRRTGQFKIKARFKYKVNKVIKVKVIPS